jgi:hypothetical protein
MIESPRTTAVHEGGPLDDHRAPSGLSLVEIAERLERITAAIEVERAKEREARRAYREIAEQVDGRVQAIRAHAQSLVQEQRRKMVSFDGMFAASNGKGMHSIHEVKAGTDMSASGGSVGFGGGLGSGGGVGRMSINEAVLKVWSLTNQCSPMTTEEIARALPMVGYSTRAAPRSIKSTLNQALAKLCRDRKIRRFRTDGTEIRPEDTHSRARKYLPV